MEDVQLQVYIGKVKNPRGKHQPTMMLSDIYGFRPLGTSPFALLAAYEFLQFWNGEAIGYPPGREKRTTWTEAGMDKRRQLEEECGGDERKYKAKLQEQQWKPGTDYEVRPSYDEE